MTSASNLQHLHVVGGKIFLLTKEQGRLNLLENLQRSASAAGAVLALGGMAGAAAGAASVALYDGEDVQHFGFILGEQMVIGTFENASFEEGDEIKAVVSSVGGGVLLAHAVVRVKDGALWMPYSVNRGRKAMAKETFRFGAKLTLSTLVLVGAASVIAGLDVRAFGLIVIIAPFVIFPIGYMVYREGLPEAKYAERILKVLGFRDPSIVNLSPFSQARESGYKISGLHYIFNLRKALAAYGSLSKARPPTAAPKTQSK